MSGAMRWEQLFADLEGQLAASEQADLASEVADRTRRELALTTLAERLRGSTGAAVAVSVRGAGTLRAVVRDQGAGWLLLGQASTELLVALDAVTSISGLGPRNAVPVGAVARTFGLPWVLRGVVRDRASVTAVLVDGTQVTGTPDRVGADFLDIAEHAVDEPRRGTAVSSVRTVPLPALALLRRL